MTMNRSLTLFAAFTTLSLASAFTAPIPHGSITNNGATSYSAFSPITAPMRRGFGVLPPKMASDDNSESTASPRKRRTRKDGKQFSPPTSTQSESDDNEVEAATVIEPVETPAPAPAAPKENVVVMQVRDIRDIVSGVPEAPAEVKVEKKMKEELDDDDEDLADDEEWEYYDVDQDGNEIITSDGGMGSRGQDDSMEQLLADARSMRKAGDSLKGDEEMSVKDKILNIISTIVTVDFFFVLALLAWFIAGIFCSYVLKDDAVQIAFNMNFEGVTRPALTVLMAGSIAGAIGNKDEEEEY